MADRVLRIVEGSTRTLTFNFRQSGAAFDLTGWTVTFFVHDDRVDKGTNLIDGAAVTVAAPTTGVGTYEIQSTDTDFDGDSLRGKYGFNLTDGTEDFYLVVDDIVIEKNPFIA